MIKKKVQTKSISNRPIIPTNAMHQKIAHYLASANICSRRRGEEIVRDGLIKVNGQIMNNVAYRVQDDDVVEYQKHIIRPLEEPKLYGYYKSIKTIVTHAKDQGVSVFELVKEQIGSVLAVGRLDMYSEGLLLLTNSNKLCTQLMHSNLPRVYKVLLDRKWQGTEYVSRDFVINKIHYKPWKVLSYHNNWLTIELKEGKNREIRKVCAFFGINIKRLIRISFGPYKLLGRPEDIWRIY